MEYTIEGELAQVARMTFSAGETCWASKGSLMSMAPGVDWTLKVPGGIGGAVRRSLSGEGISLTFIRARQEGRQVLLASNQPGKIVDWDLAEGPILTTRGSFVAAFGQDIDINVVVARRAGAALFGGAGLFLQKISGKGIVLIHGAGDFVDLQLGAGESILVSTGNLAAFADAVDYDIQGVAGCRRILFGGEGLFMTRLTGPGRVLLQTLKRQASKGPARIPATG
ncbi:MAG: TIGR00266 family protein [Anaerolineae bacterium]